MAAPALVAAACCSAAFGVGGVAAGSLAFAATTDLPSTPSGGTVFNGGLFAADSLAGASADCCVCPFAAWATGVPGTGCATGTLVGAGENARHSVTKPISMATAQAARIRGSDKAYRGGATTATGLSGAGSGRLMIRSASTASAGSPSIISHSSGDSLIRRRASRTSVSSKLNGSRRRAS